MSTILDALRRVEQDKQIARKGDNPLQSILTTVELPGGARFDGKRFAWLGIASLLLIASAIGVTYWITSKTGPFPNSDTGGESSAMVSPLRLSPGAPTASSLRGSLSPVSQEGAGRDGTGHVPVHAASSEMSQTADDFPSPNRSQAQTSMAHSGGEPVGSREPFGALQDDSRVGEDGSRGPRVEEPMDSAEPAVVPETRQPSESGVKISAIVWSAQSDRRFAVVNLKTVHEGDRVGDLDVVEIQEDGILFEEGGKAFKVMLGRR